MLADIQNKNFNNCDSFNICELFVHWKLGSRASTGLFNTFKSYAVL